MFSGFHLGVPFSLGFLILEVSPGIPDGSRNCRSFVKFDLVTVFSGKLWFFFVFALIAIGCWCGGPGCVVRVVFARLRACAGVSVRLGGTCLNGVECVGGAECSSPRGKTCL